MTLYLVRHGKTEYNIVKRYTGSTDVGLSDEGMLQAEKTAELLKDIHFDLIVSSPLLRAKITAETIAKYHKDTPMIFMDGFKERCFGDFEGKTADMLESNPAFRDWASGKIPCPPKPAI